MIYFGLFVFAIFVLAIITAVQKGDKLKKHLAESKSILEQQVVFTPTEMLLSGISFAYDADRKKVCLLTNAKTPMFYDYADVLQSELVVDNEIITKHSNTSAIGRAVAGGLLFGGVGAIVGGATSSTRQTLKVNSIELKITVNDLKYPVWRIAFLATPVNRNSVFYKNAYNNAERWQGVLSVIIKQATDQPKLVNALSTSDEILKLKSMFDTGVLSEDEFKQAKQKLLA